MSFNSILFINNDEKTTRESIEVPDFFVDLNLDQIVNTITKGKEEYNLPAFFYTHLTDKNTVLFRQHVMQDLENQDLSEKIKLFAKEMHNIRTKQAEINKLSYKYHKKRWFLEIVKKYCDAAEILLQNLSVADIKSEGLLSFRDWLKNYLQSEHFKLLNSKTQSILSDLSLLKYRIHYRDLRVQVQNFKPEVDFNEEIEKTFSKFRQNTVKDYRIAYSANPMDMNHVEAQILDGIAHLYPDVFSLIDTFYQENQDYADETLIRFDREIQFYISYLDYIGIIRNEGLKFCYPQINDRNKEVYCYDGFDLALAYKLIHDKLPIVVNDFCLKDPERIIVISGPNQGGKTTFSRMFGQLHYFSSLGCPVPGKSALLFLFDKLYTHFEKEEDVKNLRGKLQDDLVRIHSILENVTANSILIMNEIFVSTTMQDQVFLSKNIMNRLLELDLLCVWVTFIDELASFSEKNVSMISTVFPETPALRTFKIVRGPANGLAYAMSIAEKYNLTYDRLKERIKK